MVMSGDMDLELAPLEGGRGGGKGRRGKQLDGDGGSVRPSIVSKPGRPSPRPHKLRVPGGTGGRGGRGGVSPLSLPPQEEEDVTEESFVQNDGPLQGTFSGDTTAE